MKHLMKTVSFIAVMSIIPGAFAATSRVSVMGKTTSRLPSIAGSINPVMIATGTAGTVVGGISSILNVSDCEEEYSKCVRQEDVCGENFEECTTDVLFHAQMPKCQNVLSRCSDAGVRALFGGSLGELATVGEYVKDDGHNDTKEVAKYKFPTDTSTVGGWISTSLTVNSLNVQQCSKKYTACLNRDSVCGADFELCTSQRAFKKQAVFCASTLARCSVDAKRALFGKTTNADNLSLEDKDSAIAQMVTKGAGLAADNAVNTCYKVANQCILNACGANPARCTENAPMDTINIVEAIKSNKTVPTTIIPGPSRSQDFVGTEVTKVDVIKYIKNMCLDTIGNNKYCYMTHVANGTEYKDDKGKAIKPDKFDDLVGKLSEFERQELFDEVFADIYESRMNSATKERIKTMLNEFDKETKDKCVNTIKSCAMRACGGGIGSVCYKQVFKQDGARKTINGKPTYDDIKTACEAITNADLNCQYAVASLNDEEYSYEYAQQNVFTTLFPSEVYGIGGGLYALSQDPIGVIGLLNASLADSYNDNALENMKKQCTNTVISCVKSMCGKDYINCYRNRTDIYSNTYNNPSSVGIGQIKNPFANNAYDNAFNKSMNKVGGVLDYTIVTGLCMQTVTSAKSCEEHLKLEALDLAENKTSETWGGGDVRDAWLDAAGSVTTTSRNNEVVLGCRTTTDTNKCKNNNSVEACGYVDEDGCLYDKDVKQAWDDYVVNQSAESLFQKVLMGIEKEAQAKYNTKLNREQNICLAQNKGGIQGVADNGSTFKWVKLKSNKIPKNYGMKGLNTNQFVNSNDLYGSFCLSKITVQSDDKKIQDLLTDGSTAYFAVGDAFTCGSWIDQKQLDKITDAVRKQAGKGEGVDSWKGRVTMLWTSLGGAALGGAAGGLIADSLQGGGKLGGLLKTDDAKVAYSDKTNAGSCVNNLNKCLGNRSNTSACRSGMNDAIAAGINVDGFYIADSGSQAEYCTTSSEFFCSGSINCSSETNEAKRVACCTAYTDSNQQQQWRNNSDRADKCWYGGRRYELGQQMVGAIGNNINETAVQQVLAECQKKAQETYKNNRATNVGVGAALGALTVGGLGAGIAATALEAKKRKAMDAAEKEWLEQVGEHIQCYLGADNIGSYGDIVSFNFDE